MVSMNSFGDSITAGTSLSGTTYVSRIATALGISLNNYGTSGDRVPDQSWLTRNITPANLMTYMIGTNDSNVFGNSATKLAVYKRMLRSLILSSCGYNYVRGAITTRTGTWDTSNIFNGTQAFGLYSVASTGSSSTQATVYGTTVYIGYIHNTDSAFDSTVKVYIDDVLKETIVFTGSTDAVTGRAVVLGQAALRYTGLTDGAHVVKVTNDGPKCFGIEYFMGNGHQAFKNPLLVANISKKLSYVGTDSSTNNTTYCSTISDVVTELKADGLNIGLVDVNSLLVSTDYMDDVHWNDSGHTKVAAAFLTALYGLTPSTGGSSPPVYPTGTFSITLPTPVSYTHASGTWDGAGGITGSLTLS